MIRTVSTICPHGLNLWFRTCQHCERDDRERVMNAGRRLARLQDARILRVIGGTTWRAAAPPDPRR